MAELGPASETRHTGGRMKGPPPANHTPTFPQEHCGRGDAVPRIVGTQLVWSTIRESVIKEPANFSCKLGALFDVVCPNQLKHQETPCYMEGAHALGKYARRQGSLQEYPLLVVECYARSGSGTDGEGPPRAPLGCFRSTPATDQNCVLRPTFSPVQKLQ